MTNMCPLNFTCKVNLQMQRIVKQCSKNHMDFLCNQYKETVKLHLFINVLQFSNKMANKNVNKTAHKRFCSPPSGGILNLNKRPCAQVSSATK